MASETADQIDWSHPPPYTGQYPWGPRIAQCNADCKSQDLLHSVSRERATFGMPGQRTARAATQGPQYWHLLITWFCGSYSLHQVICFNVCPNEEQNLHFLFFHFERQDKKLFIRDRSDLI